MSNERTVINDRYELHPVPLARGGMGEVWEGRDLKLHREVAVKFVRFPNEILDDELVHRFVRESRITASLLHPGVPAVFDVGTADERPYLVMQRIHGTSVSDLIAQQGRLPIGWMAAIAAQTCCVLATAHHASLIHRDLKPTNLMLERDGAVKVLDFGLAVGLDRAYISQITRTGQNIGTPAYMAPEQVQGPESTPQTDLYSLGCTMHEMLIGEQLFDGATTYSVMNKHVIEPPVSARAIRADVPGELDALLAALLEKKPEHRPESALAVYERLLPFVEDLGPLPGTLNPPTTPSPLRMYARVLGRTFDTAGDTQPPSAPPPVPDQPASASPDHGDDDRVAVASGRKLITRARLRAISAEAGELARDDQHARAAELLGDAVGQAAARYGDRDDDVIGLRLEYADALFQAGDYRVAASAFRDLTDDLGEHDGGHGDLVFHCRQRYATCHALIGEPEYAITLLQELLSDERRAFGPDDPRTLELWRQIGVLQIAAGQRDAARETLTGLHTELLRTHGRDHPAVPKIERALADL